MGFCDKSPERRRPITQVLYKGVLTVMRFAEHLATTRTGAAV